MSNEVKDVEVDWERRLMYITCGNDVMVRDMLARKEIGRLRGHITPVTCLTSSNDRKMIVSVGGEGSVRRWNAESEECIGEALEAHEGMVRSSVLSDDKKLLVSSGGDGLIRRWNAESGEFVGEALEAHEGWFNCSALSNDLK